MASAKEIPPGGEGKIAVTFKTKGRHGKQTKGITVKTNDPDAPAVRLTVSADIAVRFGFKYPRLNFGRVKENLSISKRLPAIGEELASVSIQSVEIVNQAHAAYYEVRVEDSGEGDERNLQLIITATKKIPPGRFYDQLKVTTDPPEVGPVFVRLYGERVGPVEAFPRSLFLKESSGGTLSGSITLRSSDKKKFQVLLAKAIDPRLIVRVHELNASDTIQIDASLPDDFKDLVFRSELIVRIRKDKQFDLRVPVYLASRPLLPPLSGQKHPFSTQ